MSILPIGVSAKCKGDMIANGVTAVLAYIRHNYFKIALKLEETLDFTCPDAKLILDHRGG